MFVFVANKANNIIFNYILYINLKNCVILTCLVLMLMTLFFADFCFIPNHFYI